MDHNALCPTLQLSMLNIPLRTPTSSTLLLNFAGAPEVRNTVLGAKFHETRSHCQTQLINKRKSEFSANPGIFQSTHGHTGKPSHIRCSAPRNSFARKESAASIILFPASLQRHNSGGCSKGNCKVKIRSFSHFYHCLLPNKQRYYKAILQVAFYVPQRLIGV